MKDYQVSYKTAQGETKTISFEASSGTHALTMAMERYNELRAHPNRITRVFEEGTK